MSDALLATCASAGATLVAIIGGLSISRHLAIESETANTRRSHTMATANEQATLAALRTAQHDLDKLKIANLFDRPEMHNYFQSLTARKSAIDISELLKREVRLAEFDVQLVLDTAQGWITEWSVALGQPIWAKVQASTDWSSFRNTHRLPISIEGVWLEQFRQMKEPSRGNPYFIDVPPNLARGPETTRAVRVRDDAANAHELARMQVAISRVAASNASPPRGLVAGILVLTTLTVTTVIIPILYLTPSDERGPLSVGTITALFIGGVAVLFGYMAIQVWHVRRRLDADRQQNL